MGGISSVKDWLFGRRQIGTEIIDFQPDKIADLTTHAWCGRMAISLMIVIGKRGRSRKSSPSDLPPE